MATFVDKGVDALHDVISVVLLAAIGAGWNLLRQGGGLQVKTPPVPKKAAQPAADAATVEDLAKRRTGT